MGKTPDTNSKRVAAQISFALYGATSRVIRLHRPFLEPLGLTYPQFLVMLSLFEKDSRSVGDIGQELGMDNGTLTPLLKRLDTAGLVTRTRHPSDERRVIVALSEAGEGLREVACAIPGRIETACRLTREDLVNLRDTLNGLALSPEVVSHKKSK